MARLALLALDKEGWWAGGLAAALMQAARGAA